MAALTNPTQTEVRDFITQGEGNPSGMYNDNSKDNYPSHGLGINFHGKSQAFLEDYIKELGIKLDTQVNHYIFNGTTWIIDISAGKMDLIDEIIWLSNSSNSTHRPFDETSGIPTNDPVRMAVNPEINKTAFDAVVYDAYLNGKYGITGVISNVGTETWNKLDKNERLALYSLNYNKSSLIGSGLKRGLSLYTSATKTEDKMVGKLRCWYEILYRSNGGGDRKGVQNRRFMEADAFLGNVHDKIEEGKGTNNSIIPVSNFAEANAAIAFMNYYSEKMISYLGGVTGYKNRNYEIVQNNFSSAIQQFLTGMGYTKTYFLGTLFTNWNIYTDLAVNDLMDGVNYKEIKGSKLNDLVFITNKDGGTARVEQGDDEVYGSSAKDIQFASGQTLHLSEMKLTLNQLDTAETINLTGNGDRILKKGE